MIYARINVNVDTGVYLFLHISCGTEYSQHSNALAHPNPSANSNKFKLLPYHCYAKVFRGFLMPKRVTKKFDQTRAVFTQFLVVKYRTTGKNGVKKRP